MLAMDKNLIQTAGGAALGAVVMPQSQHKNQYDV